MQTGGGSLTYDSWTVTLGTYTGVGSEWAEESVSWDPVSSRGFQGGHPKHLHRTPPDPVDRPTS